MVILSLGNVNDVVAIVAYICPFLTKGRNSKIVISSNEAKRVLCKPYSAIGVRLVIFTAKEGIYFKLNHGIFFVHKSYLKIYKLG